MMLYNNCTTNRKRGIELWRDKTRCRPTYRLVWASAKWA